TVRLAIEPTILKYQKSCRQKQLASRKTSACPRSAGNFRGGATHHSGAGILLPSPRFFLPLVQKSLRYRYSCKERIRKRREVTKSGNAVPHHYVKFPDRG